MPTEKIAKPDRMTSLVVTYLRDAIYSGQLRPGQRLRQAQLAAELEVSRTPLREALRVLENEGLVTLARGNAVEVVVTDTATLLDACAVREVIDGFAAKLAARIRSQGFQTVANSQLERQQDALDNWREAEFWKADADLHVEILRATGNRSLLEQERLIRLTSQLYHPAKVQDRAHATRAISEHREIVNAICRGDEKEAERLAAAHARRIVTDVQAAIASGKVAPAESAT